VTEIKKPPNDGGISLFRKKEGCTPTKEEPKTVDSRRKTKVSIEGGERGRHERSACKK
jgi:hypothetical protein